MTEAELIDQFLLECLNDIMPAEEWEDWWENEDDPIGPDDPDDYMSEAEE